MNLEELNADDREHELEQESDEHNTVDSLDRDDHTLYNVLQHRHAHKLIH